MAKKSWASIFGVKASRDPTKQTAMERLQIAAQQQATAKQAALAQMYGNSQANAYNAQQNAYSHHTLSAQGLQNAQNQMGIQAGQTWTQVGATGGSSIAGGITQNWVRSTVRGAMQHITKEMEREFMLDPINIPGTDRWRVPLKSEMHKVIYMEADELREERIYTLWVGHKTCRRYKEDQLPDIIKSKLALIHNQKDTGQIYESLPEDHFKIQVELYICTYPDDFHDVGWQVSKEYYCIVMPDDELRKLRGEIQNDPRGEGKEQDQEDS
jgi:hypothetical protein